MYVSQWVLVKQQNHLMTGSLEPYSVVKQGLAV